MQHHGAPGPADIRRDGIEVVAQVGEHQSRPVAGGGDAVAPMPLAAPVMSTVRPRSGAPAASRGRDPSMPWLDLNQRSAGAHHPPTPGEQWVRPGTRWIRTAVCLPRDRTRSEHRFEDLREHVDPSVARIFMTSRCLLRR